MFIKFWWLWVLLGTDRCQFKFPDDALCLPSHKPSSTKKRDSEKKRSGNLHESFVQKIDFTLQGQRHPHPLKRPSTQPTVIIRTPKKNKFQLSLIKLMMMKNANVSLIYFNCIINPDRLLNKNRFVSVRASKRPCPASSINVIFQCCEQ